MTPDRWRRFRRVRLMQETGWTFDVIDRLPELDATDILAVIDGQRKAAAEKRPK